MRLPCTLPPPNTRPPAAHLSCATVGTWPGMTPKSPVVAGISTRSTFSLWHSVSWGTKKLKCSLSGMAAPSAAASFLGR